MRTKVSNVFPEFTFTRSGRRSDTSELSGWFYSFSQALHKLNLPSTLGLPLFKRCSPAPSQRSLVWLRS